ncbi:hypothetical protein [Haloglomus halophilum]|uniref:hypothetical protein n=1 Tax=Haloglomus halophilum TaxID=2962672 RepID=UPI0020C9F102|nr:hypothetical protein [Haloglomus halophilum]
MTGRCWNCSEEQRESGPFCTNCGAPQEEFEVKPSRRFLTNRSSIYLRNIVDGEITRRDDALDEQLVESLEAQLEHDVGAALGQLATVMIADESILADAARSEMGKVDPSADWSTLANQLGAPGLGYLLLIIHALRATDNFDDEGDRADDGES